MYSNNKNSYHLHSVNFYDRTYLLNNRIDNITLATKGMPAIVPRAVISPSFLSDFVICVTNGMAVDAFSVEVIFSGDVVEVTVVGVNFSVVDVVGSVGDVILSVVDVSSVNECVVFGSVVIISVDDDVDEKTVLCVVVVCSSVCVVITSSVVSDKVLVGCVVRLTSLVFANGDVVVIALISNLKKIDTKRGEDSQKKLFFRYHTLIFKISCKCYLILSYHERRISKYRKWRMGH